MLNLLLNSNKYSDFADIRTTFKYLDLGRAFIELKKYEQATDYYEKAINQLNQEKSLLKNLVKSKFLENLLEAKYYNAFALEQQQKYDLAIQQYEEIIEIFRNDPTKNISLSQEDKKNLDNYLSNSYFRIGFILASQKLYDRAIDCLEKAKLYSNDRAYIHEKLADIYHQQGKYQKSWQELEQSVMEYKKEIEQKEKEYTLDPALIDPSFIVEYWHNSLGNIYHQYLHEYDKAEKIYLKGLQLDPNNKKVLVSLTNLYLKILQAQPGSIDEINQHCTYYFDATKYYNKALKILEKTKNRLEDPSSLIDLGNFLLGTKKIATQEQYTAIENYFLKAIEKDPNAVNAYAGLGVFYFEKDKLNKAINYFKKAHEHQLGDFNIWSNLAETYLKQNKLDQAEKEFKDILAINPYHVDSNIGLGQVYLAMGDGGEIEMYHQAIDCFTNTRKILQHDRSSRKLNSSELANLFYLQGYANFQIYQKSNILQRSDSFWRSALNNFGNAIKENSSHNYAKRAKEKIEGNIRAFSGSTVKEEIASYVLTALSLTMLVGSQILCFWELPQSNSLIQENKTEILNQTANFKSITQEKIANQVGQETDNQVQESQLDEYRGTIQDLEENNKSKEKVQSTYLKFGSPGHITLTFGSFIFMVIFSYLPRITKLRFGKEGVELEKSPLQQISIGNLGISSLRISRPVEDRVNRDKSPRIRI